MAGSKQSGWSEAKSGRGGPRFNKSRVLLAGDCAHVNNPIGGMGMNGGIHDAINLAEKLSDVWFGRAEAEVFDRYTRQRRKAQVDYVHSSKVRDVAIRQIGLDLFRVEHPRQGILKVLLRLQ